LYSFAIFPKTCSDFLLKLLEFSANCSSSEKTVKESPITFLLSTFSFEFWDRTWLSFCTIFWETTSIFSSLDNFARFSLLVSISFPIKYPIPPPTNAPITKPASPPNCLPITAPAPAPTADASNYDPFGDESDDDLPF